MISDIAVDGLSRNLEGVCYGGLDFGEIPLCSSVLMMTATIQAILASFCGVHTVASECETLSGVTPFRSIVRLAMRPSN